MMGFCILTGLNRSPPNDGVLISANDSELHCDLTRLHASTGLVLTAR